MLAAFLEPAILVSEVLKHVFILADKSLQAKEISFSWFRRASTNELNDTNALFINERKLLTVTVLPSDIYMTVEQLYFKCA